ncbi:unnamed protein product [Auanema sp. JU1783]|nr:unnamed protein product [Auanema sp. JU1783]
MLFRLILFSSVFCQVFTQINLGSFSLHPANGGGFNMGLGQSANIFGFGGDRGFQLGAGPQQFNLQGSQGALVGGERVGVDSGFGLQPGGLDLGSQLQFGNQPAPYHPQGQFGSFLDNIKNFFTRLVPFPAMTLPQQPSQTTPPPTLRPHLGSEGQIFGEGERENTFEESIDEEQSLLPMDGDAKPTSSSSSHSNGHNNGQRNIETKDSDSDVDSMPSNIFSMTTERPRQLPGLIEFL